MLQIVVSNNQKPISSIKDMIVKREIDTWKCSTMPNGNVRLDWTGGQLENWEALDETVYFELKTISRDSNTKYIKFWLHTHKGHCLSEAEYTKMHSELLYMLFAHMYSMIFSCEVMKSIKAKHKADIIDD